ncbi:MAG TPA: GreA/GreB family elongation factor [Dermatophilaceae bacterium]|nr:GreA/GreB family elongation factor [Dermatophilaceae bacterium]
MTDHERVMLTPEGRASLLARADQIAREELPAMRPLLVEDERDERVVADFERLQAEHDRLVVLVGTAGTLELATLGPVITLGSRVAITDADGQRLVVRIVDPVEAYLDEERISNTSPLAIALLGHSAGDECVVVAPASTWTARVLAVGEEI